MLTIPDAANHFKVSTATIRRWIRSGRVRAQLTLGPFGEQWMVDPNSEEHKPRSDAAQGQKVQDSSAYVPVEQLIQPEPEATPDSPEQLLREAEQAVQEAWQARQQAEAELDRLRQQPPPAPAASEQSDLMALRCDLEGSERQRDLLARQVLRLEQEATEAWGETRSALKALERSYAEQEKVAARSLQLERENECLRRALGQRLGLPWQDYDLIQLFLRWEAVQDADNVAFRTASLDDPNWSEYRRARPELERKLSS